jgi:hypothetical protein
MHLCTDSECETLVRGLTSTSPLQSQETSEIWVVTAVFFIHGENRATMSGEILSPLSVGTIGNSR